MYLFMYLFTYLNLDFWPLSTTIGSHWHLDSVAIDLDNWRFRTSSVSLRATPRAMVA